MRKLLFKHPVKSKINRLGLVSLFSLCLFIGIFSINSCTNKEADDCAKCKQNNSSHTKDVVLGNDIYIATTDENENSNQPATTVLSDEQLENVESSVNSIMSLYSLSIPAEGNFSAIGAAQFFESSLESSPGAAPGCILLYHRNISDQKVYANVWQKAPDNSYTHKPNLSGITTMVSKVDFYSLNTTLALNAQEILLFLDLTKLPTVVYPTVFQVKLDIELENAAPTGGGGGGEHHSSCNSTPECGNSCPGWCFFQERQNGPASANCICEADICPTKNLKVVLDINGYNLTPEDIQYLYDIRDQILLNSEKGQRLIDDYYYAGLIMNGKITFSLALKLYTLYGIDLFKRFPQWFSDGAHDGNILIDDVARDGIQEICDEARLIDSDPRFQLIISNVEADINNYHNKPFSTIRSDFQ